MATKKARNISGKAKKTTPKKDALRDLRPRQNARDAVQGGARPEPPQGPYVNHNEVLLRG
jgi:hypothetical protein